MKPFIKLNESFDFQSLQKDVLDVYEIIKKDAINNEYEYLANRNISSVSYTHLTLPTTPYV